MGYFTQNRIYYRYSVAFVLDLNGTAGRKIERQKTIYQKVSDTRNRDEKGRLRLAAKAFVNMIKILHCSDLHLGSPVFFKSQEKASAMRKEIRNLLASLMLYIKADQIDLLLISGDLFDDRFITPDTASMIIKELASAPKCKIVISPGSADPISKDSVYKRYPFPQNVYIFESERLSCFEFTAGHGVEQKIRVYGYGYTSSSRAESALPEDFPSCLLEKAEGTIPYPDSGAINIFCGQAAIGKRGGALSSLSVPQIRNSAFDYMAIGGDHNGSGAERAGKTYYGISGCLCGHSFSDVGYKGAVLIEADKESGSLHLRARGLRFFKKRFVCDTLSADGARSENDIKKLIADHIAAKRYQNDTALKIILTGNVAPSIYFDAARYEKELSELLFTIEIEDLTIPLSGFTPPESCLTLKDLTLKRLSDIIQNGNDAERRTAAHAFRIAYNALSESQKSDDQR